MIEEELRYKPAIELIERVLQDPDLARKERVEAYRLLGIAYASKGKPDSAQAAFGALLELEPDFVLDPLLSPKIISIFEQAQAEVLAKPRLEEVTAIPEDRRITISANVVDPKSRVQDVLLFSRFGDREYEQSKMERTDGRAEAILILPELDRLRVEYYLEARDASGDAIAHAGSLGSPSSIVVERQPPPIAPPPEPLPSVASPTPWYAEWWVWAIAIGVVGAGVATVVVIERSGNDDPHGTLDPIHLD